MTAIRRIDSSELRDYIAFLRQGLARHPDCFRISPKDVSESLLLGTSDEHFTLGAFSEAGLLLGVVSFTRDTHEKMRHKGLLSRMYVASEAAGQGLGRRLIAECLTQARALPGLETVTLTVVASNAPARRLYLSKGFVPFALEKNALKMGEQCLDEEQMALDLRGGPEQ